VTMLLGPSGSGKSLLGLQFLAQGARQKQPGVYFGFYERPAAIMEKSRRLDLGLHTPAARDLVQYVWQPPVEGVIDVLAARLLAAVKEHRARRLVIDGMQGFQIAADHPARIADVLSAITDELEAMGVTTLYTLETHELFGSNVPIPIPGLSNVTQNLVLLRYVEEQSRLSRLISIVKVRDSDFDTTVRELIISEHGLTLADAPARDAPARSPAGGRPRTATTGIGRRKTTAPARKGKLRRKK
jgi:circadian clock protein KaiC